MPEPKRSRTLASKFFIFTAMLVFWVVSVLLANDLYRDQFGASRGVILLVVVVGIAAAISRMTTKLLARPLGLLQEGIKSVMEGRLEPIEVSRTGDEIELLGNNFNLMVAALEKSRKDLLEHQNTLEERIRQRTRELQVAMQKALAASEAKSEFLTNMSHELRTPMNGILGMLDIVLATPIPSEQRDHLETAHSCAYTLLALLNDVLDLSKIEAGSMLIEKIAFDPRELVEEACRSHKVIAIRKGVRFVLELSPSLPATIEADQLRLRQIIANLAGNAVKFTDNGTIRIEAGCVATGPSEGRLSFAIHDTGPGIPAAKLGSIFEKFTQADGSITRRFGGTGLGLTITKRLVELNGGTIRVESEVGRGSSFIVELPYREPKAPLSAPGAWQEKSRILVVDDNAVNRKMVTAILVKHGYRVSDAKDGQQAIELLERDGADLVLMDIQMPVLDGLGATRQIRSRDNWAHLPIIAMTAHAMNGDRDACEAAGMDAYLSKPVHAVHLLHTVQQMLSTGRETPVLTGALDTA